MSKGLGDVVGYVDKIRELVQRDRVSSAILGLIALAGEFYPEFFMTLVYLFGFTFTVGKITGVGTQIVNWRGSNRYNEILNDQIETQAQAENKENENYVRTQVVDRKLKAYEKRAIAQTALIKKTIENATSIGAIQEAVGKLDDIEADLDDIHDDVNNPFKSLLMKNERFITENIPNPESMEEPRRFKKINEVIDNE